jgi:hypothetical protein
MVHIIDVAGNIRNHIIWKYKGLICTIMGEISSKYYEVFDHISSGHVTEKIMTKEIIGAKAHNIYKMKINIMVKLHNL